MELKLDRLSKQYRNNIGVDRISYSMTAGVYGLLGVNGAGKTTLMRLICTVLNPTSGSILFDGNSIHSLGPRFCDVLGYLPQDFGYYPDFSARDFMLYMASLKGIPDMYAKKRTEELLGLVGLSGVSQQRIRTFSGGMKQRLGIAQAVLNDPKILVLDEPTAGLDPKERIRFRNLISDLSKDKIVILSTHIVSDVEYIADQILLMKKGRLILSGSVDELVKKTQGLVWQVTINAREVQRFEDNYCVSNLHHTPVGAQLRLLSQERPTPDAQPLEANLEDLFLYYFADEIHNTDTSESKI